jgi:hypothetical protein
MAEHSQKISLTEPTVTIPLWVYNTIISTMHYAADNGGNLYVSTEVRRVIKQLETFKPS